MARTKKAATKTTVKTASVSETPAKSVVTTSEENAVKAETPKTDDAKVSVETKAAEKPVERKPQRQLLKQQQEKQLLKKQRQLQKYMFSTGVKRYILPKLLTGSERSGQMIWAKKLLI